MWMGPRPALLRAIEKYREGGRWRKEGFWSSASCIRQSTDSIVGVNIWRKYGGSPFLLSSFHAYRRRWGAGNRWDVCEIIFRRARSTLSEISDEWKAFFFFHLFSPFLLLPRSPSLLFSFPYRQTWDWVAKTLEKIDRHYAVVDFSSGEISTWYINRGRVCCASVPSSRVTQFRYE